MEKETKKEKYKILVDQKPFEWEERFISGSQIKSLVAVPASFGVWLKTNGPEPDKEIGDSETIDLDQPGREHFFTGSKGTTEGYVPA